MSPADTDDTGDEEPKPEPVVEVCMGCCTTVLFKYNYLCKIFSGTDNLESKATHVIDPSALETQLPDYDYSADASVVPGVTDPSLNYYAGCLANLMAMLKLQ